MARSRSRGSEQLWYLQAITMLNTLKDEFLSSAVSAPSSLLVALSKDVGHEALSAHCTWMQMTMAHYSCLLSCTQMWQHGFQKRRERL